MAANSTEPDLAESLPAKQPSQILESGYNPHDLNPAFNRPIKNYDPFEPAHHENPKSAQRR